MEEQRIVGLRAAHEPLHRCNLHHSVNRLPTSEYTTSHNIVPRRNLPRVRRVVCKHDDVVLLVTVVRWG